MCKLGNYYLYVEEHQVRTADYEEVRPAVVETLKRRGIALPNEEIDDFVEELLKVMCLDTRFEVRKSSVDWGDPKIHLGKVTKDRFFYAQALGRIKTYPDDTLVMHEYGNTMTMREFRALITPLKKDGTHFGRRFF